MKFLAKIVLLVAVLATFATAQSYDWATGAWINHGGNFAFSVNSGNVRMRVTCDYTGPCLVIPPSDLLGRDMHLVRWYPSSFGTVEVWAIDVPLVEHHPDELFRCFMLGIGPPYVYKYEVRAAEPPTNFFQQAEIDAERENDSFWK
jgi:hypothetical protein